MRRAWVAYWQLVRERLEQQHQHQEQGALRAAAVAGVAVAPLLPVRTHASAQSASVGVPVLMSIQQASLDGCGPVTAVTGCLLSAAGDTCRVSMACGPRLLHGPACSHGLPTVFNTTPTPLYGASRIFNRTRRAPLVRNLCVSTLH